MQNEIEAVFAADLDDYTDPVFARVIILWVLYKGESDLSIEHVIEHLCPNIEDWRVNELEETLDELRRNDVLVETEHEFYRLDMQQVGRLRYSQSKRIKNRHASARRKAESVKQDEPETEPVVEPVKKKRGRPPKVKPVDEAQD